MLFERHTDSKRWLPGEADLSRFAGREIRLRLESHPGPKRNTTRDSSFWGDPVVLAGEQPQTLSIDERKQLAQKAIRAIETGTASGKDLFVFALGDECRAAIVLGRHGLADAAIGFGSRDRTVVFDGLLLSVRDHAVGEWPSAIFVDGVRSHQGSDGRLQIVHRLRRNDETFDLTAHVWTQGNGLRIKVDCPSRITDVALGSADQKAPRVYYGHGFCLVNSKAFRASGGGHNLSTSHVGFEFERGVCLLMACDTPPEHLQVDPERNIYTLHTHPDTMLPFVPSLNGALDCALKYRPLYDKQPSDGVVRKAGRFCFDIWGGGYADDANLVQCCFDYGLTDSLVTMHVWQRWGYDYRLPDIFPPDPRLGTLTDLQAFSKLCSQLDLPFGLHDMHFYKPQVSRFVLTGFQGGGKPPVPTSQWQGRVTTGENWTMTIPDDCPPGEYDILVGLYDPASRDRRERLLGDEDSQTRHRIGTLVVEGAKTNVTAIRLDPAAPWADESLAARLQPNATPVDFGVAKTTGAFRCAVRPDGVLFGLRIGYPTAYRLSGHVAKAITRPPGIASSASRLPALRHRAPQSR